MIPRIVFSGLLVMGANSDAQILDTFQYASADTARQVWRVVAESGNGPLLSVVSSGARNVLELPLPFEDQPNVGRIYIDASVTLNLATVGGCELEVEQDSHAANNRLSLYFRSGSGWYAAGCELAGTGWQTLRFSKADFVKEGEPTGWHSIDGIRIAVWRGMARNTRLRLSALKATQHDVALLLASGETDSGAPRMVQDVGEMLQELGLGADALEQSAVAAGALGNRAAVVLAYNPGLSAKCTGALIEYVERGGKILACYQLPPQLGAALGFANPEYHRPERPGTFAEMRFDDEAVEWLPAVVRQASWNVTTLEPVAYNARTIARWYSDDGKPTGRTAVLLSDRGAFVSHVILGDDREKKKQMLAALLGHLAPSLWQQMADSALQRSCHIGHLTTEPQLRDFLRNAPNPQLAQLATRGDELMQRIESKLADRQYTQVMELAGRLREERVRAFMLAQPSREREGRAFWNHTGTGAYDGDWDRTARELSAAGFNMVIPNMLWGGRAHYPSDLLPRSTTYEKYGDQIAQCLAAAREHGLQVHVWKVNWNLSGAPPEFVAKIRREGRNQVSVEGKSHDWLCPSHPENFRLELESMLEVARKYDVDGLHFDYIRYPDRDKCYCDGCRERFQQQRGLKVANWPRDCYSGTLRGEYATWRCAQISRLVAAVHDQAKALRPTIEISAAVFGAYPNCRESVGQDWLQWVQDGYLDFVCPMDYTQNNQAFVSLVENQLRLVEGRIPVYPGVGQWRLSDDRTVGQIHLARELGAAGFTLFDLSRDSVKTIVPAVGLGVGRQQAATPHRK